MKTKDIKGRELQVGDHLALEGGVFSRVTEIVKAPMLIEHEDGKRETPKWAYLANGDHATICRDDEIVVRA